MFELLLRVLELVFDVELKDSLGVVADSPHIWVFQEGMHCNREEALKVLDSMSDANSIQEDLEGVDWHVYYIFIFGSKFEDINHLIDDWISEVFILTELVLEDNLYNSDELD